MKKLIFLFTLSLLLVGMAWGANLVNENIQTWTARGSYGTYTQTISAGTVNMVQCIVQPSASANGTGTIGRVQMQAANGILTLPSLSSIGTITFNIAAGGAGRTTKLQSYNGSTWTDITTFSGIGTVGSTFSYNLNTTSATQIRLAAPSSAIYVHDIIITDFVPAGNIPPSINNISINPSTGITSSTQVTVSATIIDSDGTIETAEVYWGTSSGNRPNFIEMTNTTGDTWTATIPAQANNTTVYYSVYAIDDDADDTESAELNYTVTDPVPEISVNPASRSGFTYVLDEGPSPSQTFTVSGSNLDANIVITASTNYEISEDNSSFSSPITLTQSGGSVGSTTIYVRLKAERAVGAYNNENITITSTNADSKTVTCSGEVSSPPPPNAPVATYATAIDDDAFTANWSSVSGATGYKLDVYKMEAGGNASDLFISEYIEGSSDNKYIELYNGTGASVDLSNYELRQYNNGSSSVSSTLPLSGTLADGATYVIANSSGAIYANPDLSTTSSVMGFNGDDALELYRTDTFTTVDIFGCIGRDPGSAWSSGSHSTANRTLVRKSTVMSGVTTSPSSGFPTLETEWDVYAIDTTTYLGSHTFSGGLTKTYVSGYNDLDVGAVTSKSVTGLASATEYYYVVRAYNSYGTSDDSNEINVTTTTSNPLITLSTTTLSDFYYVENHGPSAAQSFTVSGENLTANISIVAATNYEISLSSGSGYTSPLTLTQSGGTVGNTTVYVRLKAGLNAGDYNEEVITVSSTGAADKTVTCSGEVTTPAAPSAPLATAATVLGSDSFTANWGSVSGATGYYLDVYTKTAGANATDLFISEYVEGSYGNNKYIEIFNGTGTTVDLTAYKLGKQGNGAGTFGTPTALTGTLANGAVYIFAHSSADIYTSTVDQTSGGYPMDFNGNDCVALYKNDGVNDVQIDVVGVVNQTTDWGKDVTLVRKSSVSSPTTTYSTDDWVSYAANTVDYLGSHTMAGGSSLSYVTGFDNRDVSNVTSFEVTNLDPETTYYYVVRAYDAYSQTSSSSNEIEVTTTAASTYDYPEDTEIDAGAVLIEITGGNGIIVSGTPTPVPNPGFTPTFEQRIELTGDGPWIVTVFSEDEWVACLFDGAWMVEEVPQSGPDAGYVYFGLEFPEGKNTIIELKSGNGGNPTLPVELSTFTATISSIHNAVLTWVTQTETNVQGFYIYRNMANDLSSALQLSGMIPATNTSQQQVYQFTDKELNQTGTYYYWLMVADMDGSEGFHGPISLNYEQGGLQLPEIPKFTELKNVYPNPFNPSTTISYALANSQNVNFNIFNNRGQMVRSMELGNKAAGNHSFVWDGCDNYGRSVSTGVYFIRMQAGSESFSKKAVLMK